MAEKGTMSAKGELVNFDLMKIKAQIATAPKTVNVKARENFIDQKFKRRLAKQTKELIAEVNTEQTIIDKDSLPEEPLLTTVQEEVSETLQEGLKHLKPKEK